MDRNEDQKFIATYGRDKTFVSGLEGSLANCDEMLFNWFALSQASEKLGLKPTLGGYEIHFSRQRATKTDPIPGTCAAFFDPSEIDQSVKVQDLSKAALLVRLLDHEENALWCIQFPSEAHTGSAFTKLVNEMLKQRMSANA